MEALHLAVACTLHRQWRRTVVLFCALYYWHLLLASASPVLYLLLQKLSPVLHANAIAMQVGIIMGSD
jgi:hypothetical protein